MNDKTSGQDKTESTNPEAPMNWVGHTFTGSITGHTGKLEMRWYRSGNTLTIQTLRYMFTGNGSRNKANINIKVKPNAAGEWKLNSPDDRKQDGNWHTWDTQGALTLGSSNKITVEVEFIFDLSGIDDRHIVTVTFNV